MRVLIATDGSASAWHALREAIRTLPLAAAEVHVAVVAPVIAVIEDPRAYGVSVAPVYRDVREAARRDLDAALAALLTAGIQAQGTLREGDPAMELLALAEELKPALIVVGSHGRGGVGRFLLGSVSDALVHRWPGAVLVVRQPADALRGQGEQAVSTVMHPAPVTVPAEASVTQAARLMRERGVGWLPVVREGRLIGVVTDRDLVVRVLGQGQDPAKVTAGDVCTPEVVWVAPQMPLEEAVRLMEHHRVRRVAVLDGHRVAGVVAIDDLAPRTPRLAEHALTTITKAVGEPGR
ncbi:MAG: CBS domain-containing protein [Candidatus Sericytochromatia bacterium]|nr:CBS domain-containing protein [Candidatus Sericytochromatia bacterium]